MDCRELGMVLDRYMDGELSNEELRALEAHAETCEACAREYAAARQLSEMLAEVPEEISVPLPAQAKWREAVKQEASKRRARGLYRYAAGIAAAVLVLVGVGLVLRPGSVNDAERTVAGEASKSLFVVQSDGMESRESTMAEAEDMALEEAAEAPERAAIANAVPMREIALKVQSIDEACDYIRDLIAEYEGTLDEQRIDSDGAPSANLFVELPGSNAPEFASALAQYAKAELEPLDVSDDDGAVSLLLVLTAK